MSFHHLHHHHLAENSWQVNWLRLDRTDQRDREKFDAHISLGSIKSISQWIDKSIRPIDEPNGLLNVVIERRGQSSDVGFSTAVFPSALRQCCSSSTSVRSEPFDQRRLHVVVVFATVWQQSNVSIVQLTRSIVERQSRRNESVRRLCGIRRIVLLAPCDGSRSRIVAALSKWFVSRWSGDEHRLSRKIERFSLPFVVNDLRSGSWTRWKCSSRFSRTLSNVAPSQCRSSANRQQRRHSVESRPWQRTDRPDGRLLQRSRPFILVEFQLEV